MRKSQKRDFTRKGDASIIAKISLDLSCPVEEIGEYVDMGMKKLDKNTIALAKRLVEKIKDGKMDVIYTDGCSEFTGDFEFKGKNLDTWTAYKGSNKTTVFVFYRGEQNPVEE